jgi:pyridoxine 5-phosphate synthase
MPLWLTPYLGAAGAPGITVHPRQGRTASGTATCMIARLATESDAQSAVEFNIEGDPRPGFIELVLAVKPTQCTLVPVSPGEITSHAGYRRTRPRPTDGLIATLKRAGVRECVHRS